VILEVKVKDMRKLIILSFLLSVLMMPIRVEGANWSNTATPAGQQTKQERIEAREARQQERIEARETRREELRIRLEALQDERRQRIAEHIDDRLAHINEQATNAMTRMLERMTALLEKLASRLDKMEEKGRDIAAIEAAIAEAEAAIAEAQAAVDEQAGMEYEIEFADESGLRVGASDAKTSLKNDLRTVKALIRAARQAVVAAVSSAKAANQQGGI